MATKGILLYNMRLRRYSKGYISSGCDTILFREILYFELLDIQLMRTIDSNQSVLGAETALSPFRLRVFYIYFTLFSWSFYLFL